LTLTVTFGRLRARSGQVIAWAKLFGDIDIFLANALDAYATPLFSTEERGDGIMDVKILSLSSFRSAGQSCRSCPHPSRRHDRWRGSGRRVAARRRWTVRP